MQDTLPPTALKRFPKLEKTLHSQAKKRIVGHLTYHEFLWAVEATWSRETCDHVLR